MSFNSIRVNDTDTGYTHSIFDISEYNSGAIYSNLSAALDAVPQNKQHGGMTVRYLTEDNKYVQYRLMSNTWSIDTDDWSFCGEDVLVENLEFVKAVIDKENKILWAIKADGSIYLGTNDVGVIFAFLGNLISSNKNLQELLNEKVDSDVFDSFFSLKSSEDWYYVILDTEGKIVEGLKKDGALFITEIESQQISSIEQYLLSLQEVFDALSIRVTDLENRIPTEEETYKISTLEVLPSYYHVDNYIEDKVQKINEVFMNLSTYGDIFAFFTDAHYYASALKTGLLLEYLLKNSHVKKVFYGGDTNSVNTSYNSLYFEVNQNNLIASKVRAYGKYLPMKGNHDNYNSYYPEGESETTTVRYPLRATVNSILNQCNVDSIVLNDEDVWAYYYYDEKFSKIRYIVIDMYNSNRRMMLPFIAQALLDTPSGYDNIILGHTTVANSVMVPDEYGDASSLFGNIRTLIAAVQNNGSYTYSGETFNFENNKNKIIAFIGGHIHEDAQNYINDTVYIGMMHSASYYGKSKSAMYTYHNYQNRTKGTINEDSFDVVICGREKDANTGVISGVIECVRIGCGFNRKFNLEKRTLLVGDTLQLVSTFDVVSNWLIHDSTGAVKDTTVGENEEVWQFTNNVATISNSGLVTALSAGECYAIAIANSGDKEFFYIKVD